MDCRRRRFRSRRRWTASGTPSCGWRPSADQIDQAGAHAVQEEVEAVDEDVLAVRRLRDDCGQAPASGDLEQVTRFGLSYAESDEGVDLGADELGAGSVALVAVWRGL